MFIFLWLCMKLSGQFFLCFNRKCILFFFFLNIYLRHTGSSIFLPDMCDLVPNLGIEPRPPAVTAQSLTTGPLGKSLDSSNMGFWIGGLLLRWCV